MVRILMIFLQLEKSEIVNVSGGGAYIHLCRRGGDGRPSWECLWEHGGRGSEPSPSVPLSLLSTQLLISLRSSLSFTFAVASLETPLFVFSLLGNIVKPRATQLKRTASRFCPFLFPFFFFQLITSFYAFTAIIL